jgi:hypothetical protein
MTAVVGFLRAEGEPYHRVVARAGVLAADWWVESLPATQRRFVSWLPRPLRLRAALKVAGAIARAVNSESQVSRRVRGMSATVKLTASVFCSVRASQPSPLCGFYVALVVETLKQFGIAAVGHSTQCRAVEGPTCVLTFDVSATDATVSPALAA